MSQLMTNNELSKRLRAQSLYGVLAHISELSREDEHWLLRMLEWEETEKAQRSLERRLGQAKLGRFKPMCDFDWSHPKECDREAIEELLSLRFQAEGANVILVGPNGIGKTMIAKNLASEAAHRGQRVCFVTASEMLNDLSSRESARMLEQRLRHYVNARLLVIDELGYLSFGNRYADLLFEVVRRRYESQRSLVVTTNKVFQDWKEIFPSAGCVVTLVDRLVHRSEIVVLKGESYRLKEAQERSKERGKRRRGGRRVVKGQEPSVAKQCSLGMEQPKAS